MARMHSGGKGKSGSSKPDSKSPPSWSNSDKKEVEKLISELANEGNTSAMIGTILRDKYGVPNVRFGTLHLIRQKFHGGYRPGESIQHFV